jgi:hypothetical protein
MGGVPDQFRAVDSVKLACGGGYVCAVINYNTGTFGQSGAIGSMVHVFDPVTDQTILLEPVQLRMATVVYAGSDFWIIGADVNDDLMQTNFDPATDESLPALSSVATMVSIADVAASPFNGGYVIAALEGTTAVRGLRMSSAGAILGQIPATPLSASSVAVAGGTTLYSIAVRATAGGAVDLRTYDTTDSLVNGPTTVFASTSPALLACTPRGGSVVMGATSGADAAHSLVAGVRQSDHVITRSPQTYYDARMTAAGALVNNDRVFYCFVDYEALVIGLAGTTHVCDITNQIDMTPQAFLLPQLASPNSEDTFNHLSQCAAAGTKFYFPVVSVQQDLGTGGRKARYTIYEAEMVNTGRRQMAQVGGELFIAGGLPLVYDGRVLVEAGFAERPVITSGSQGTTGSLTLLGVYNAVAVWECFDSRGRLLRSQAGSPSEVTLTGANDSIQWNVTTPHSLRRHPTYEDQAMSVRVSVYRSEAGQGVFFLDEQVVIDPTDDPAEFVQITSTQSDADLIDNIVLYEQSQTPVSHVSPAPFSFVCPSRERALSAGGPEPEAWQMSKLLFPAEVLEWAPGGQLGYSGRVGQRITAVGAFENAGILWTEQEIWLLPGRGPERNGVGEFDPAVSVATPGGTSDWRSVIVAPPGAFFQMRPDRLMLLSRDAQVSWVGAPVQDTLALYPDISGVVFVRELDQVVFACNNALGTDGVFLVYDLSTGQWFVDTIGAKIDSVSELDGRLVYVSGGIVFQQNAAVGTGAGALPTISVRTGSIRPFTSLGYGDIIKIGLLATYLGDCTVDMYLSYDDGKTWSATPMTQTVTAAAFTNHLTGAAISAGDPVTLLYTPNVRTVDRFSVRFDVTHATNTGGIRLHVLSFEAEAQEGTVRRAARDNR